jgi:hypothetical protein
VIHRVFVGASGKLWVSYDAEHCSFALETPYPAAQGWVTSSVALPDSFLIGLVRGAVNGGRHSGRPARVEALPEIANHLEEHWRGYVSQKILDVLRCCLEE